ncbi:MAG: glycosyltransferase family 2 protein [Flavobacteriales bacterium]
MISIIVPIYNVEKYLPKCLDSLLNQTFKGNYELILINDGSTDNSGKIVDDYKKKYPDKIKVIHKKNEGQGIARNIGIDYAKGKYLMFVDSDDWVKPNMLEDMYNSIESKQLDLVVFNYSWENDKGEICGTSNILPDYEDVFEMNSKKHKSAFIYMQAYPVNKIYKKELFQEVRFPSGVFYEDVGTNPLVFHQCKKIGINRNSYYHYLINREGSVTSSTNKKKMEDFYKNLIIYKNFLKKQNTWDTYKEIYREWYLLGIFNMFGISLNIEDRKERKETFKFIRSKRKENKITFFEILKFKRGGRWGMITFPKKIDIYINLFRYIVF